MFLANIQILTENKDSPWPWYCCVRLGGSLIQLDVWVHTNGECLQEQTRPAEIGDWALIFVCFHVHSKCQMLFLSRLEHPSARSLFPSGERERQKKNWTQWVIENGIEIELKMWTWQWSPKLAPRVIRSDYGCLCQYVYQGIEAIFNTSRNGMENK